MQLYWVKQPWLVRSKSCEDCAIKRGFQEAILKLEDPFMCHERYEDGRHRVCAGWKKKLEEFKKK